MLPEAMALYMSNHGIGVYRDSDTPVVDSNSAQLAIFMDALPSSPASAIAIAQYGGMDSDSKLPWDEPRVQVKIRGTEDPSISRGIAYQVYNMFHGLGPVNLDSTTHAQLILALHGGPVYLGIDQTNRRHIHVVNLAITLFNPDRRG